MTFDELQKTWQSQEGGLNLNIDSSLLLREVKRNKKHFESAVFWRDVREAGGSFVMVLVLIYLALRHDILQLLITVPFVLFVGVFIVADRIAQKKKQPLKSESLTSYIKGSLGQVKHQIWLLKNVFWWYLLPLYAGIFMFVAYVAWLVWDKGVRGLIWIFCYLLICALLYWGIYHLNQSAVRKELVPRKQELEQLLNTLKNGNE